MATEKEIITGLIAQIRAETDPESITPEMVGRILAYQIAQLNADASDLGTIRNDLEDVVNDIENPKSGLKAQVAYCLRHLDGAEGLLDTIVEDIGDLWTGIDKINGEVSGHDDQILALGRNIDILDNRIRGVLDRLDAVEYMTPLEIEEIIDDETMKILGDEGVEPLPEKENTSQTQTAESAKI